MGGIFGGSPKPPPIQPVQPAPLPPADPTNASDQAAQQAAAEAERRRRTAGGRAANILTSPQGILTAPSLGAATLLGNNGG